MLAITCDKCRRRSTLTTEEIRAALAESQGKKHAQILCPHCGKHIKVAPQRLEHALRLAPPPAAAEAVVPEAETKDAE
jgi:RNase P subunit RPR2